MQSWIKIVLHGVIWLGIAFGVYTVAVEKKHSSYLTILAARETYLAKPVFAQFIVTQTLNIDRSVRVSEIGLPLLLPENSLPLTISLIQEGKLVHRWKYPVDHVKTGVVEAQFPFIIPTVLQGLYEFQIDGSAIAYEDQQRAPGIFIEPQDANYPFGSYRVAENIKQGDVSLSIIEEKTNWELYQERFAIDPLGRITHLALVAACLFVLSRVPSAAASLVGR